jgi:hypothetical protein
LNPLQSLIVNTLDSTLGNGINPKGGISQTSDSMGRGWGTSYEITSPENFGIKLDVDLTYSLGYDLPIWSEWHEMVYLIKMAPKLIMELGLQAGFELHLGIVEFIIHANFDIYRFLPFDAQFWIDPL